MHVGKTGINNSIFTNCSSVAYAFFTNYRRSPPLTLYWVFSVTINASYTVTQLSVAHLFRAYKLGFPQKTQVSEKHQSFTQKITFSFISPLLATANYRAAKLHCLCQNRQFLSGLRIGAQQNNTTCSGSCFSFHSPDTKLPDFSP